MKYTYFDWIRAQLRKQPAVVGADLAGKTVLVLGANAGIGFEATMHFARMQPARLIMACRNEARGSAAAKKLKAATGYDPEVWLVDLTDFGSVSAFADRVGEEMRLDILVANAALARIEYEGTKDGWEASFQVANLATPLVILRLLPAMIKTAKEHMTTPRIVVVASEVHYWVDIEKKVLDSGNILKTLGSEEYCRNTKYVYFLLLLPEIDVRSPPLRVQITHTHAVLNIFFVRALNAHLPASTSIIINAVNPGFCTSELRSGLKGFNAIMNRIVEILLAFTAEEGSRNLVFGAVGQVNPESKLRGAYVSERAVEEPSDFVVGADGVRAEAAIWKELLGILGEVDGRVADINSLYLQTKAL
ncbi:hypothetical protein MKEN_01123500 [Mycena kentingensis (nom. inval.)]|nr:hypothetical protein MKEN_01123500 [Mycena kentingensis (nom. inval.)]